MDATAAGVAAPTDVAASTHSAATDFAAEEMHGLPPGCTPHAITLDGHVLAFWEQSDGRLRFTWDGMPGAPFDGIADERDKRPAIYASPDGTHLAYVGMRGDTLFVGHDGVEDPPLVAQSRSVPPVFSRDGRHLAYGGAVEGEAYRLIVDGRIVNDLLLAPIAAVFGPDGERLAYVEMREPAGGRADVRIVLDGRPGPWFAGLRNAGGVMQFSPDGSRFAYQRVDGEGHCQWVVDDVAQRLTNEVMPLSLSRLRGVGVVERPVAAGFSPDGRRFAYFADVVEKGVAIVEDDVPGPLFKAVGAPIFSPDSRRLAYVAETFDKRMTLVVDGVAGPEWPSGSAGTPVFSPDSRRVAITIGRTEGGFLRKRHRFSLVVDGAVLAEMEGDDVTAEPVFSPDGQHVAWWVRRGEVTMMMLDGAMHTAEPLASSDPVFTSSGRLVYGAVTVPDGRATVRIDGRDGAIAMAELDPRWAAGLAGRPALPFAISPDGEHVAWAGMFGEELRPVLDERVGPPFDQLLGWTFDAAGTAAWWARRGETILRVTAAP
jgi:roadblock/LC7 domain-containing protein